MQVHSTASVDTASIDTSSVDPSVDAHASSQPRFLAARSFLAMLHRDMVVSLRRIVVFFMMMLLQPLFFLYTFGEVLPATGLTSINYVLIITPGIVGLALFLAAMQTVSFKVVSEFGWTREIEDRLLAPLPTSLVAVETLIFGTIQGAIAAAFVPLFGWLLNAWPPMGQVPWLQLVGLVLLGSFAASAVGLTVGSLARPEAVGIIFSLVLTPLMFLGGPFLPWAQLDPWPVLKWAALLNPLCYLSEALRAVLSPALPHMELRWALLGLAGTVVFFTVTGLRGFLRRAHS